jgi:hypothetical protein
VAVSVKTNQGATKNYKLLMRMYELKNDAGQKLSARWIIVKFEPVA